MELSLPTRMAPWSRALTVLAVLGLLLGLTWLAIAGWENAWALGLVAVSFGFLYRLLDSFGYQVASLATALAAGLVWGGYQGPWLSVLFIVAIVSLALFPQRGLRPETLNKPTRRVARAGDLVICSQGLAVVTESSTERLSLAFLFDSDRPTEVTEHFDGHLAAYDRRSRRRLINRLPLAYLLSGPVLAVIAYQLFLAAVGAGALTLVLLTFGSQFTWPGVLIWTLPGPLIIAAINLLALTKAAYQLAWKEFRSRGLLPNGSIDQQRINSLIEPESDH